MSKKNKQHPFYGKTTLQNAQTICEYVTSKLKTVKSKEATEAEITETLINRLEEVQVFNLRNIVEPIMGRERDGDPTVQAEYKAITGLDSMTGQPKKDWSIPYNSVYVEAENTKDLYCAFLIEQATETVAFVHGVYTTKTLDNIAVFTMDVNIEDEIPFVNAKDITMEAKMFFMSRWFITAEAFRRLNNTKSKDLACYQETYDERTKYIRVRKDKVLKITNRPTYIILNKKDETQARKFTNAQRSQITYACSWIVRGHYRNLQYEQHIGKDRFGNYTMVGKTWIEPYIKGDRNLPLKQTEKIVL